MPTQQSLAAVIIGQRLRRVRQELGVTLEELGALSGINWTTIGKIERGVQNPNVETIVRLASSCGVDPGSIITGLTAEDFGGRPTSYSVHDFIAERRHRSS